MNENTSLSQNEKALKLGLYVHRSFLLPLLNIALAGIAFELIRMVLRSTYFLETASSAAFWWIRFFELILTFYFVVYWLKCEYRINPEKIEFTEGIFFQKENFYAIKNIESASLRQGIIGKIFNFGTLTLMAPTLKQNIQMRFIRSPHQIMRLIETLTPNTDLENVSEKEIMVVG